MEMGLDPLPAGDPQGLAYYESVSVKPMENITPLGVVEGQEVPPKQLPAPKKEPDQATLEAQAAEEKKFRAFAKRRIKENKLEDIPAYEFKFLPAERQKELLRDVLTEPVKSRLEKVLEKG